MAPAPTTERSLPCVAGSLLLLFSLTSCGDALSFYAPPQKEGALMELFPPERAVGSTQTRVIALIARPATESAEVLEFDFGDGVVVTEFSTGGGAGCQWTEVEDAFTAYTQSRQTRFPICFELDLRANAAPGTRAVLLDLNMDSRPVIARASFSVLASSASSP